jgi:hypothetical protein
MGKLQGEIIKLAKTERRRVIGRWCLGLGLLVLCLALMAISNPLGNPESGTSIGSLFMALGYFDQYAPWLVLIGILLILIAVMLP